MFIAFCIWEYSTHRRVAWPLAWLLGGHIFAMIPDLLYRFAHIPHEPWMDIFLGHITTHFILGRNWTWYILFMISFGVYLLLDSRRHRTSGIERRADRLSHPA